MKKIPWYRKIQIQIPVIVFLIILIPVVVIGLYDIHSSRQRQLRAMKEAMETDLYKTSLLMRDAMSEVEETGKKLADSEVISSLTERYQQDPDDSRLQSYLLLLLTQTAWPCSDIETMYFLTENVPYILSSDPETQRLKTDGEGKALYQSWQKEQLGQTTWAFYRDEKSDEANIAYWRSISFADTEASSLVCVLKNRYLSEAMDGLCSREGSLNVISSYQGKVLYGDFAASEYQMSLGEHPLFQQAYTNLENKGSYLAEENGIRWLVTYYNSLEDGWKYMTAVPEKLIYSEVADQKILYILVGAGMLAVLFGSTALHLLVNRPLGRLQKKLELMEQGQLEPLGYAGGKNEIAQLLSSYDRMILRLKKLIDEVYIQQLLRKQAELSSLQSKMDEHFLYNTLNTIYCKASEEQAPVSAAMILKLSQYFRLSLSDGREKIPLNEILEMLRAYLQIQQMRYGQTLTCKIETFPGMQNYVSLKQIYQPLIENAVIHGFEKKPGSHSLHIAFQRCGNRLRFLVEDDGVGMSEERCREAISEMPAFGQVQGRGYALRNIREQIRIVYGETYGIQIESKLGQGTRVTVEVPLEGGEHGTEL